MLSWLNLSFFSSFFQCSCFTFPKEMCDFSAPLVYTDLTCFRFASSYRGANEHLLEQRTGCFSWPIYLFLSLFSVLCSLFRGRILLQDSMLLIMAQHRAWCNYTLLWRFRCCSACLIIVIEVGTFWNGRHIQTEQQWTCLYQKRISRICIICLSGNTRGRINRVGFHCTD